MCDRGKYPHTYAELDAYFATEQARMSRWEAVASMSDLEACKKEDDDTAKRVQYAFWQDTFLLNTKEQCALLGPIEILLVVGYRSDARPE